MYTMCPFCNMILYFHNEGSGRVYCDSCPAHGFIERESGKVEWFVSHKQTTKLYNTKEELIQKGWEYHD